MAIRLNPDLLPNLLLSIQESRQNLNTATQQLSTGKRVNSLAEDPAAVAQLVRNHDQAGQDDQFLKNQTSLQSQFQVADSALSNVVQALTRAISIGTEGANGTLNGGERQAIAGEVLGLANQIASLANVSYQGAYLFSGTAVTTQPFALNQSTLAATYSGNSNSTNVQLSNGNVIGSNVPGSQLFLNGSGSVFGALQGLFSALQSNTNVGAAVTQVQDALTQVNAQRVFYGNALNQITLSENFLNQDKVNLSTQENSLIGADPAAAASDLAQAQTAYQSELAATAKVLNLPSLLNFLQ
jgi:flagellar hook-associated protein 3 FlgL